MNEAILTTVLPAPAKRLVRHAVFWPPFLLLGLSLAASLIAGAHFVGALQVVNNWVLDHFYLNFLWGAFFIFLTCLAVFISPLSKIKIGGEGARPILTTYEWFTISLCTNTAVGIFFWATAEPMFHLSAPPLSTAIKPQSVKAAEFAMSALYMHWSLIPCALYALPALMFALAFYNLRSPYSLAYCWQPLVGKRWCARLADATDAIALYSLVAGMAASLATGILTLAGGIEHLYDLKSSAPVWIVIGLVIAVSFLGSALTGLQGGIRILSAINTKMFFVFLGFFLVFGPLRAMLDLGLSGFGHFATHFFDQSLFFNYAASDPWPRAWTVFYWAVWIAWAPVTAMFLGKIAYGHTVRKFMLINLIAPALFAIVWMSVIGGAAITMQMEQANLLPLLEAKGPESVAYAVMQQYPWSFAVIPFFLFSVFISYVTSADSNTLAMAGMCTKGLCADDAEPVAIMKYIWAAVLAAVAIVMLCTNGVDGIRILSYLGGLPALFFELGAMVSLWILLLRPQRAINVACGNVSSDI